MLLEDGIGIDIGIEFDIDTLALGNTVLGNVPLQVP